MKIPKDKLPLKRTRLQVYGQYGIMIEGKNKYAGQICYKDLSQYVVDASNKFPEAIELLNMCMYSGYLTKELENEINEFLKILENE